MRNMSGGFTLVELVVVIIIIGVLSAVALPHFIDVAYKARASELPTSVRIIQQAEEIYYAEENVYAVCPWADTDSDNANDAIELLLNTHVAGSYFFYGTTVAGSGYSVEAWVKKPFGGVTGGTKAIIADDGTHTYVGDASAIAKLKSYCNYLK